jgi:hypothetical protein
MGEKRDSGSKDADNFGAEFGTDRRLEQRQAATRRNQAVQRNRRERKSRVDDRAMTNVPVVTSPNNISNRGVAVLQAASGGGGGGGGGVLNVDTRTANEIAAANAVARALQSGRPSDTGSGAVINQTLAELAGASSTDNQDDSLFQDLSRSLDNVIFGDEFGGNLRPRLTTLNVSPILASTQQIMDQGSDQAVPTTTDIVNASIEQARANQGSGLTSLTGDPMTDANIAGFQDTTVPPLASGTTTPASPADIINQSIEEKRASGVDKINEGGEAIRDDSGMIVGVVHDGILGKVYTGRPGFNPFAPPERPEKDVTDPCPPGFQLIGGVCRPTYDVTAPVAPPAPTPGSNFQMTPTVGFPTSFAPMTQATPVSLPDPFVLSPTGAAIGRRV